MPRRMGTRTRYEGALHVLLVCTLKATVEQPLLRQKSGSTNAAAVVVVVSMSITDIIERAVLSCSPSCY